MNSLMALIQSKSLLQITKKETLTRNFRCKVRIDCLNDLNTGSPSLKHTLSLFCLPAMRLARGLNVVPFMLISSSLCARCIQPLTRFSHRCNDASECIGPYMSRCVENQEMPVSHFLRW